MVIYKFVFLAVWLFNCAISFGQWANNNWVFGNNIVLSFNSGQPIVQPFLPLDAKEGCATISDPNGNLLFYTDGDSVYDRNGSMMPNGVGLFAGNTSTQGALIVKKPGTDNSYFLFTVPSETDSIPFVYSEIDIMLNGGNGDVTTIKNVQLLDDVTEKLTGIVHNNGNDIWVIVHGFGTNAFYFYLVNSNGVGNVVNVSNVGSIIQGTDELRRGYMRASIDGSKLAMTNDITGKLELFQLNNEFGFLYNEIILDGFYGAYGLEFSPNGQKLYMTRRNESGSPTVNELFQFDLTYWQEDSIMNSAQIIDTISGFTAGALALGPDGVVYVAQHQQNFIGAILEPDLEGFLCQYVDAALYINIGSACRIGLPNFIKEPLDPSLNIGQIPDQEKIINAWWAAGSLNFELLGTPAGNWDLSVHDLAGRKVVELDGRSDMEWKLSTAEWKTGVYVWRWKRSGESRFGKVYVH